MPEVRIVLLRGINLAGRRRVGMADLRELLAGHGYEDVRTHLQSGNVLLSSPLAGARLEQALERQLADGLGFEVDVLVRSRKELAGGRRARPARQGREESVALPGHVPPLEAAGEGGA